jgi:hypothetical protein
MPMPKEEDELLVYVMYVVMVWEVVDPVSGQL